MNTAAKYISYYKNDYQSYIHSILRITNVNQYEILSKFIRKYPLTERLIQDMSLVFKNSFTYTYNGTDKQSIILDEVIRKSNLKMFMVLVNKYINLVNDVGILPRYYNGKIIYDLITPDKCIIKQVDGFPTQIQQLYYFIDSSTNTYTSLYQVNTMYRITADTISIIQLDTAGNITKQTDIQPNPYGYIPVVWFNAELPYDTFWSQKVNPIIQMHEYYVLAKTFETVALQYQALASLITKGLPPDQKIKFGPMFWLNLPASATGLNEDYDAKYITPDADFTSMYSYSQQLLQQAAIYAGLSAESFKHAAQYNSGYQLALSKTQLLDYNRMQKDMFNIKMEQLFKVIIDTFNIYNPDYNLSNAPVSIHIPQFNIMYSSAEQQSIADWQLQHNVISQLDLLRKKYSTLTEEQILTKYNQNKILNGSTNTNTEPVI